MSYYGHLLSSSHIRQHPHGSKADNKESDILPLIGPSTLLTSDIREEATARHFLDWLTSLCYGCGRYSGHSWYYAIGFTGHTNALLNYYYRPKNVLGKNMLQS